MKFRNILPYILIILFFAFLIRAMIVYEKNTVWRNDNFCKLKYHTTERDYDRFFGKYCAVVNYDTKNITKYYYTNKEMYDYCQTNIKLLELNRWGDKCS